MKITAIKFTTQMPGDNHPHEFTLEKLNPYNDRELTLIGPGANRTFKVTNVRAAALMIHFDAYGFKGTQGDLDEIVNLLAILGIES